jgi:hypothetical protein
MLTPGDLSARLESEWLGQFPASPFESGEMFAGAVAGWFLAAQAAGIPCATAAPRRPQLSALAAGALKAGIGPTSGALLAAAVAAYYAGQAFGVGVAGFPTALPAAMALTSAALLDLGMAKKARADQIAQACHLMALSTIVVFPTPAPPAPIT